jgi:hypothetical protein
MKLLKRIYFSIILISAYLINFEKCSYITDKQFENILAELSENNFINQTRKIVYFKLKNIKKKSKLSKVMTYLSEFLRSSSIESSMYNLQNQYFVALTDINNFIDRDEILLRFKDTITEIGEGRAGDFMPKNSDL